MSHALLILALALLLLAIPLLGTVAARRIILSSRERRRAEAERRVRPLAIALVESAEAELPALSAGDQAVLAEVLGRYARKLSGEADARIAAYFRSSAALRAALRDLSSRRGWRRADAAYRLGDMGCDEVEPQLFAALRDRKREVRAAAARSLGRLGAVDAVLPLIEALVERTLPHGVAGAALMELGTSALPELRGIAEHPDPEVRATAVALMGLVGDSRDSEAAVAALRDPSADVRTAAAEALGRVGAAAAEAELRRALDDRIRFVRAAAAGSLGVIDAHSAVPKLLELARTDVFRPARAAARAAARIDPNALVAAAAEPDAGPHLHEAADLLAL
jgi:HEAT repeat protein